jgi:aryl-alcohol dehydrogenase-like predicted oxidoreductase
VLRLCSHTDRHTHTHTHTNSHTRTTLAHTNNTRTGINLIDTAPWYGFEKSERILGEALQGVPREAYYLATKVGRYKPDHLEMFDFRGERVLASIDESLARLRLDYIDIIQIHDPEFAPSLDIIVNETLPALDKARQAGKVRFIGITGGCLGAQRLSLWKRDAHSDARRNPEHRLPAQHAEGDCGAVHCADRHVSRVLPLLAERHHTDRLPPLF